MLLKNQASVERWFWCRIEAKYAELLERQLKTASCSARYGSRLTRYNTTDWDYLSRSQRRRQCDPAAATMAVKQRRRRRAATLCDRVTVTLGRRRHPHPPVVVHPQWPSKRDRWSRSSAKQAASHHKRETPATLCFAALLIALEPRPHTTTANCTHMCTSFAE